jgi:hypothetical protein
MRAKAEPAIHTYYGTAPAVVVVEAAAVLEYTGVLGQNTRVGVGHNDTPRYGPDLF